VVRAAPPHAVPVGPLAVRWLAYDLPPLRAGTRAAGRVTLENAGSATWRSQETEGVQLAHHWLDPLGNPIVWDGHRTALPRPLPPGEQLELPVRLTAPMPPGDYVLAFDLVHEHRFWFAEVGNAPLEVTVAVRPRLGARSLAVRVGGGEPGLIAATRSALAAQEETIAEEGEATAFLSPGCRPDPDWSRRVLDAHAEGFAAVAGSIAVDGGWLERRRHPELDPWRPGFGRVPDWPRQLLCPSLLVEAALAELSGLPALDPTSFDDASLCDGRIRIVVDARALRRGRRPGA
jgi:hypothetical protein